MAGAWTTLTILDGGGTSRNMRVWDESGSGTGPFSFGQTSSSEGVTTTNRSSTITVGGTSQQLAASNSSRRRIIIMNPSDAAGQGIAVAESLYINFGAAAGINNGTAIELNPGSWWDSGIGPAPTDQINVNAATAGHVYIAKEM